MAQKFKIVLTGGIASGKSTVSKILENNGFSIVDADAIAHKALAKNVSKIKEVFGEEYIKNGEVDRKKLGVLVFGDKKKLKILEDILRKDIYNDIISATKELEKLKKPYVVDIPLFFEKGGLYKAELTVLVYAPKKQQIARLIKRDRLNDIEASNRVELQIDIEKKRQMADMTIDNSKDLQHLQKEVENFIKILKDTYASL